jgi:hypothetical protein
MKYLFPLTILLLFAISCKNDSSTNESKTPDNNNTKLNTNVMNKDQQAAGDEKIPNAPGERDATGIYEKYMAMDISNRPIEVFRPANAISTMLAPNPTQQKDPVKPVIQKIVPRSSEEAAVLKTITTNYWVIWGLVRINRQENKVNQGAYYKFKEDGTFEFGLFGKKIGNGGWSFNTANNTITIDSELLGDDREWTYDLHSSKESMVWIGTPKYYLTDVQVKLDNYYNIPKTRAEAALPDFE